MPYPFKSPILSTTTMYQPVYDNYSSSETDTSYDVDQSSDSDSSHDHDSIYGLGSFYDPGLDAADSMHDSVRFDPDPAPIATPIPEPEIWTGSNQTYPRRPFGNGPGTTLNALNQASKRDHQSGNYYSGPTPALKRPRIVNKSALEQGACQRPGAYQSNVSFDIDPRYDDLHKPQETTTTNLRGSTHVTTGTQGTVTSNLSSSTGYGTRGTITPGIRSSIPYDPYGTRGTVTSDLRSSTGYGTRTTLTANHTSTTYTPHRTVTSNLASSLNSKPEYRDPFDPLDFSDLLDEPIKPAAIEPSSTILTPINLWDLTDTSKRHERVIARKSAVRFMKRLRASAADGSLAFTSNFVIKIELPDGTKVDPQARQGLFKYALGEYLPLTFLKVNDDSKTIFVIKGCESLKPKLTSSDYQTTKKSLLIGADQVFELYSSSKVKAEAMIKAQVEEVTKTIEDRMVAWSPEGIMAFVNRTEVMVEMPIRVNKQVVEAFETELAVHIDGGLTKVERYCPEGYPFTYVIKVSFRTSKSVY